MQRSNQELFFLLVSPQHSDLPLSFSINICQVEDAWPEPASRRQLPQFHPGLFAKANCESEKHSHTQAHGFCKQRPQLHPTGKSLLLHTLIMIPANKKHNLHLELIIQCLPLCIASHFSKSFHICISFAYKCKNLLVCRRPHLAKGSQLKKIFQNVDPLRKLPLK